MKFNRRRTPFQWAAWIACIAVLWSALVPAIAQAVTASAERNSAALQIMQAEICTVTGMKMATPDHGPSQGRDSQSAHQQCGLCMANMVPAVLPDSVASTAPLLASPFPSLFYQSPAPLFSWCSVRSRAPPSLA